jgi:Ycf66 protein N-terminus
MLAYILAVLVGTSSVGLYLWAFLFPEIHRKQDFIWSGVGLFYALFLWLYARQVTGGILVGQTTSVVLLGWFGWETFKLRRQLVPIERSSNTEPNASNRQQPIDSRRTTPEAVKPTPPTAVTLSKPQSPAATPDRSAKSGQTPVASGIPLARVKVPPATPDRSTPIASKVTPPEPLPTPVNPSFPQVTPLLPPVTQPIAPSPVNNVISPDTASSVTEDEAWIKLEIKPAPSKPLGTPTQPPTVVNNEPAKSPAVEPEIIPKNIPTNPTPTTTETESEHQT